MPLMPIHCRICYRSIAADVTEDGDLFTDLCSDCEQAEWWSNESEVSR